MKKLLLLFIIGISLVPLVSATIITDGIEIGSAGTHIYPNGLIYGTDVNVDSSMVRSYSKFQIDHYNDYPDDLFYGTMTNGSFFAINDIFAYGTIQLNITQAFVGSGLEIDWYYTVSAGDGYWDPLPIIEDQSNNFSTTGLVNITFNYTEMDNFYGTGPYITYRGYMIMAHVSNVDSVTTEPQVRELLVSPRAIEIHNQNIDIDALESTVANTNYIDEVATRNYFSKANIYLKNTTLNIGASKHLDMGYSGTVGRRVIITDNYDTSSTINLGGSTSASTGSSLSYWSPDGHIGRHLKPTWNIYNSKYTAQYTFTEQYHQGVVNIFNSIIDTASPFLFQGYGTFEKTTFVNAPFYLYSANYDIKSLILTGNSPVICGWNRELILKNTDFSGITSEYQISGSANRARYHLINPIGYDNDLLAMRSYSNHTKDGHVWEYYEMDLKINDIYGVPIPNADITITNGNGDVYSGTTNSSGQIDTKTVLVSDTWNDGSASCSSTYIYQDPTNCKYEELYNPLTIEIDHPDYLDLEYRSFNLTKKEDWTLTLLPYEFEAIIIHNDADRTLVIG